MKKFVHCPNRDDLLNRQKLSVTFRTYEKSVELFAKSQVRFLALTLTRSAKFEKTAISQIKWVRIGRCELYLSLQCVLVIRDS